MTTGRCLIAMSGGVDSSVSAALMQQAGYDCVGVTMNLLCGSSSNCSEAAISTIERRRKQDCEDAKQACDRLGIPHQELDLSDEFSKQVVAPFVGQYSRGYTPNPCIMCNRSIKFSALMKWAQQEGYDCMATGHYARIEEKQLFKASNLSKDQSYVLYMLAGEQLDYLQLPLGKLSKEEVREHAEKLGLATAQKHESQDICFIPEGDYAVFLEEKAALYKVMLPKPGKIVSSDGKVLGTHAGVHNYTIGQRRGLRISGPQPLYVQEIQEDTATVVVGNAQISGRQSALLEEVSLRCSSTDIECKEITAKHRYRGREHKVKALLQPDNTVRVEFLEKQRDLTRGQSLVLYDGDRVLGGGTIVHTQ